MARVGDDSSGEFGARDLRGAFAVKKQSNRVAIVRAGNVVFHPTEYIPSSTSHGWTKEVREEKRMGEEKEDTLPAT